MKPYEVVKETWHLGIKQPIGTVLHLFESQAKYLGHALEPLKSKPAQEIAPVEAADAAPAKRKTSGASVAEVSQDGDASN